MNRTTNDMIAAGGAKRKVLDVDSATGYIKCMNQEYSHLEINLSDDELAAAQAEAARTSLPLDGCVLLRLVDMGLSSGQLLAEDMMSAQQHLAHIADKIERDGVQADDVFDLVQKLRQLSNFSTTRPIPMDAFE